MTENDIEIKTINGFGISAMLIPDTRDLKTPFSSPDDKDDIDLINFLNNKNQQNMNSYQFIADAAKDIETKIKAAEHDPVVINDLCSGLESVVDLTFGTGSWEDKAIDYVLDRIKARNPIPKTA